MLEPGLYIVGTPIGNLEDITLRALETLRSASWVLAEDTRHSRGLLERHGIRVPLQSCHKFNEASRADVVVESIRGGQAIALITDSGMPAVSDPGARLVAACREAGVKVVVIPGPSAVTAAVALSGLVDQRFFFEGFLDNRSAPRRRRLGELSALDAPIVLFESPFRLLKLMDDIEAVLGARRVYVGRELTKHFEESLSGTPADIRAAFSNRGVKGELVVVIGPGCVD